MNLENPIDLKTSDLLLREEIVCELIANQHLTTRINFSTPDSASMSCCRAEMQLEELDLHVHLQHSRAASSPDAIISCRIALRELLIEKMLTELQTAQTLFSGLEPVNFDGPGSIQPAIQPAMHPALHPGQMASGPARPKAASGYLPVTHHRSAGGYLPVPGRNAGPTLPSTHLRSAASTPPLTHYRNAGGYLPSAAYPGGRPAFPGNNPLPAGPDMAFGPATIRTNYSLIEQHAARLLQLKEAIRGIVNLQHRLA